MKIQLASDFHLEFLQKAFPGERLIAPAHETDMLALATSRMVIVADIGRTALLTFSTYQFGINAQCLLNRLH